MSRSSVTSVALACAAISSCSSGPQLRSDSRQVSKASAEKQKEPLVVTVAETDRDGDGIPDSADRCPDEPEDYDGFQDDDGCPDRDNDDDGVPDADDRCPNTPGPPENAGCPFFDGDGVGRPTSRRSGEAEYNPVLAP